MEFAAVIEQVIGKLDRADIRYALIGGFAMALRGIQRATIDLDFILMLEDLDKADAVLQESGYTRVFRSENVSHYSGGRPELGRIDILHAFRGPSLSMLERAERISVTAKASLPVVQVEDLIGLKIQAAKNDPSRLAADWSDIRMLVESSSLANRSLDWELILDYLRLFESGGKIDELRSWYDAAHNNG